MLNDDSANLWPLDDATTRRRDRATIRRGDDVAVRLFEYAVIMKAQTCLPLHRQVPLIIACGGGIIETVWGHAIAIRCTVVVTLVDHGACLNLPRTFFEFLPDVAAIVESCIGSGLPSYY